MRVPEALIIANEPGIIEGALEVQYFGFSDDVQLTVTDDPDHSYPDSVHVDLTASGARRLGRRLYEFACYLEAKGKYDHPDA